MNDLIKSEFCIKQLTEKIVESFYYVRFGNKLAFKNLNDNAKNIITKDIFEMKQN